MVPTLEGLTVLVDGVCHWGCTTPGLEGDTLLMLRFPDATLARGLPQPPA